MLGLGDVRAAVAAGDGKGNGRRVVLGRLVGGILERGGGSNQVDDLPLDNLVAEGVDLSLLLQAGANPAGAFVHLFGDQLNFLVEVFRHGVDLLVLGDPLQDEMLLEGPRRVRERVAAELVGVGVDGGVIEAAGLQFHDGPVKLPFGLAAEELRRQIPTGGDGQQASNLLADLLLLLVFQLAVELFPHFGPQFRLVLEAADAIQEAVIQLGQFQLPDFQKLKFRGELFAAEGLIFRVLGDGHFRFKLVANLFPHHQVVKAFQLGVVEAQDWTNRQHLVVARGDDSVAVQEGHVHLHDCAVAGIHRALELHEIAVFGE